MAGPHQGHQPRPPFGGVAVDDQAFDRRVDARADLRLAQAKVARPHQFTLAHRNAADDLRQTFAETDAYQVLLEFAERIVGGHAFGVRCELAHRLDIGRQPGQSMGGALLAVEQAGHRMALHHHPFAHFDHRVRQQRVERRGGLAGEIDQVKFGGGANSGSRHGVPWGPWAASNEERGGHVAPAARLHYARAVHKSKPLRASPERMDRVISSSRLL